VTTAANEPGDVVGEVARRQALGIDKLDEVWEGTYRIVPVPDFGHGHVASQLLNVLHPYTELVGLIGLTRFNLGTEADFRVPDGGYLRQRPDWGQTYVPSAALVVEVLAPGDLTYAKFPFYAAQGVEEIVVADPDARRVTFYALDGGRYVEDDWSAVLAIGAMEIEAEIEWPP
jgi:Uma2 family endonuclease